MGIGRSLSTVVGWCDGAHNSALTNISVRCKSKRVHAFDVLGDPVRRRILALLVNGERAAGEVGAVVQEEFGISQSGASQHLRVLRDNGFATVRAVGTRRVYAVNPAPLQEVDGWLERYRQFWTQPPDAPGAESRAGQARTPDRRRELVFGQLVNQEGWGRLMIAIASGLSETHREVGRRRIAAGEAHTALIRRHYDVPLEDTWDACTNPDRLSRWFGQVIGDFRLGGTVILGDGENERTTCEIVHCEAPRRLAVTWMYPGRPVDEVELRLSPGTDDDTMLEVEHASVAEVFISNDVERGLWGVGASWEWLLDQLDAFLRDEAPDTTDETAAEEAATLRGLAWSTLVEAAFTAALADPTPTQGTHGVSGDPQDGPRWPSPPDPLIRQTT